MFKSLFKKLGGNSQEGSDRTDPVCGMTSTKDSLKAEYQDKSYYFCSEHCKNKFLSSPGDFA